MPTAKEMREISEKVREDNRKRQKCQDAEYEKRLSAKIAELVPELRSAVLNDIKSAAERGYDGYTVSFYDHGDLKDTATMKAYEQIMKELKGKPYKYRVKAGRPKNDWSGEGNNESDFYALFTWTISW